MIKVTLSNEILKYITEIDKNRYNVSSVNLSPNIANKLRKNSKKKSSYASNKIEGNPLTENQVDEVIENDNQFHACIIEECGLKRLYTLWSSMDSGNTIVFYRGAGTNEYVVHNQEKIHRRVLDAVKTGDVQVICKTLIDHYMETTIGYLKDHGISTEEFPYKINVNF